jgi:hypothetical protein
MKKIFFLICLISIFTSVHANERVIYGNDFEIIRNTYDGEEAESVGMGSNSVILEGDRIEASIQMSSGPSCLFEGVKLEKNIYAPNDEFSEYGESCRVILDIKSTSNGETLSISNAGRCAFFCGAGAELKASGLQKY